MSYEAPPEVVTIIVVTVLVLVFRGPKTVAMASNLSRLMGRITTLFLSFALTLAAGWLGLGRMELEHVDHKIQILTLLLGFPLIWLLGYFVMYKQSLREEGKYKKKEQP